eukprot:m.211838 g.211838  ORF g.211838 m.211838 type:complete len:325 (+) comp53979_c0_seq2:180-1154(+)
MGCCQSKPKRDEDGSANESVRMEGVTAAPVQTAAPASIPAVAETGIATPAKEASPTAPAPAPVEPAAAPAAPPAEPAAPAPAAPAPAAASPPTTPNPPAVFAIMRNTHEGLRMGIKQLSELLDDAAGFSAAWQEYQRVLHMHAYMEDNGLFAMLDAVSNNQLTNEGIPDEHPTDHRNGEAVEAALASGDGEALKTAFEAWRVFHLAHLEHEEKVQMPLVGKTAPTPDGRARVLYEKILKPAEAYNSEEVDFWIGWVVKQLTTRGSTANTPLVATRVFAHGLQMCSDAKQWARWLPIVKANTSEEIWQEMTTLYFIENPGPQVEL